MSERLLDLLRAGVPAGWTVEPPGEGGLWARVAPPGARPPRQGWKLHLSATEGSATELIGRALPVLAEAAATFKASISTGAVAILNAGAAGPTQVGKVVTIYPATDAEAVGLAKALDEATRGLVGPPVVSDRPIRPGSVVHYRYGAFGGELAVDPLGRVWPMLTGPDGAMVPDDRSRFEVPSWTSDPFVAAGVASGSDRRSVGGRYALVRRLHRSPRGSVYLAADVEGGRSCVVKEAPAGAWWTPDGRDARDRLRAEAGMLRRVEGDPRFPRVLDVVEEEHAAFLVLEQLEGERLDRVVAREAAWGRVLPGDRVAAVGREVASALAALHEAGIAHRDVKTTNVLLAPDGSVRLVDFEHALDLGAPGEPGGTPGFASAGQLAGSPASAADDLHGLNALLVHLATGADPQEPPTPTPRSVDTDPRSPRLGVNGMGGGGPDAARLLEVASGLAAARLVPSVPGAPVPDLCVGLAGVAIALAEVATTTRDATLEAAARDAARGLSETGDGPPGLFAGAGGVAAALLRTGRLLGDDGLVSGAADRARRLSGAPIASPDLFSGEAGRLRLLVAVWRETGDGSDLDAAARSGEALVGSGREGRWVIPQGNAELSGTAPLGYAHGAAGIAEALLDVHEATGEERWLGPVRDVVVRLTRAALPALADGRGLVWPDEEGGAPAGASWRRGAAGIGRVLARAAAVGIEGAAGPASRALAMVADGARGAGPSFGDGLAGMIDAQLVAFRRGGDSGHLRAAAGLGALLEPYAARPDRLSPGYLDGAAGVALALVRLASAMRP